MKMNNRFTFERKTIISAGLLLFVISFCWIAIFNKFQALYYSEQIQLFQFTHFYLLSYWNQPGSIIEYLGAFLTQFNYYPILGGCIYAIIVTSYWLLGYSILKKNGFPAKFFGITFIPSLLMLACLANTYFDLSYVLGIFMALACFRILIQRMDNIFTIVVVISLVYFMAAGNVWLVTLLYLIQVSTTRNLSVSRWLLFPLVIILSTLIPYLAWKFCYTAMLKEAFWGLTPPDFTLFNPLYVCLWLSVPFLSTLCIILKSKNNRSDEITFPALLGNIIYTILITGLFLFAMYDRHSEHVLRMSFQTTQKNWMEVLSSEKNTRPTQLSRYLTNLALSQSGQLPYKMFYYQQTGVAGLLLPPKYDYFSRFSQGDAYGQLGLVAELKHCTFEAMVGNAGIKEHNVQCLQRLLICSVLERDTLLFDKYAKLLESSLFYRSWVKKQREQLFANPGASAESTVLKKDFFISYSYPEVALLQLLDDNPTHKMAFEYLMAYYMLQRQFEAAKRCFDKYYANFDYPALPDHYAELLVLYKNANKLDDQFYNQYKVPKDLRDKYESYELMLYAVSADDVKEQLLSRYGNTYWFYASFPGGSNNTHEYEIKTIY